jgi:hypothetical protein
MARRTKPMEASHSDACPDPHRTHTFVFGSPAKPSTDPK